MFGVFSSGFFAQNNSNVLVDRFSHVFGHLNFWPKLTILQSAFARWPLPLQDGRFLKWSHFSNIWCFFQRFFAQNNSNLLVESFLVRFWPFEFLSQADHFAKSIAFARWPIFKMVSFLEYLVFFQRFFAQNNSNVLVESFFARFWPFEFLTQADHFAKSIAFARWPIFKLVYFLEYLVFFAAVFCTEQL